MIALEHRDESTPNQPPPGTEEGERVPSEGRPPPTSPLTTP